MDVDVPAEGKEVSGAAKAQASQAVRARTAHPYPHFRALPQARKHARKRS
jgi:hypothetical protein